MGKNKFLKKLAVLGALTLSGIVLTACGNNDDAATGDSDKASADDVRVVKIGIGNAYNPFCYLDENEELAGYEYEVLKLVDEKLPQYEFSYEPTEFSNILVGLDTGTYDMGVHGFGWNEDRAKKYLYSETPSVTTGGYVILGAEGKNFKTLDDLAGKKVQVKTGGNVSNLLEAYNKENPKKAVEIVYEDSENEQIVSNLTNGVYDAYINEKIDADQWVKQFDGLEQYGSNIFGDKADSGCYYLYNKDDEQLEKDVSAALKELHEEGKTGKLSTEYLGEDYTK
ncbi:MULTISPECIES: transporter substrate-binding domain-containing protein [Enterococcus]|uniref:L-cystine transport system substrate-binding protein n=1 Tax=Candidatus Enterococcus ferrettii TaxID=2815324 RepID=A0ABV0EVM2_9ENTE|nr:transporter substrate-binding domain-containing protein [Enterococcus sp. 665A]MBO1342540.1 transporter substrate-binding domain-containing protein [Enterococcus sp. 665A]